MTNDTADIHAGRKRAAALLARATVQELETAWNRQGENPKTETVRGPETGLVMVKGRIGGGGAPFNLGETTVTRATIKLASGTVGHAHVLGTGRKKPGTPPFSMRSGRKARHGISSRPSFSRLSKKG